MPLNLSHTHSRAAQVGKAIAERTDGAGWVSDSYLFFGPGKEDAPSVVFSPQRMVCFDESDRFGDPASGFVDPDLEYVGFSNRTFCAKTVYGDEVTDHVINEFLHDYPLNLGATKAYMLSTNWTPTAGWKGWPPPEPLRDGKGAVGAVEPSINWHPPRCVYATWSRPGGQGATAASGVSLRPAKALKALGSNQDLAMGYGGVAGDQDIDGMDFDGDELCSPGQQGVQPAVKESEDVEEGPYLEAGSLPSSVMGPERDEADVGSGAWGEWAVRRWVVKIDSKAGPVWVGAIVGAPSPDGVDPPKLRSPAWVLAHNGEVFKTSERGREDLDELVCAQVGMDCWPTYFSADSLIWIVLDRKRGTMQLTVNNLPPFALYGIPPEAVPFVAARFPGDGASLFTANEAMKFSPVHLRNEIAARWSLCAVKTPKRKIKKRKPLSSKKKSAGPSSKKSKAKVPDAQDEGSAEDASEKKTKSKPWFDSDEGPWAGEYDSGERATLEAVENSEEGNPQRPPNEENLVQVRFWPGGRIKRFGEDVNAEELFLKKWKPPKRKLDQFALWTSDLVKAACSEVDPLAGLDSSLHA
mmetsp:Transcript_61425/g.164988  ORF Transcript_61425/g.164988 Transcript_61425/m.164988 type:complete len:581 (+) Transcript_61425:29-1771(+)